MRKSDPDVVDYEPLLELELLAADRMDGGHLGRIASDALDRGMTTHKELEHAVARKVDITSMIEQAAGKVL